VTKRISRISRCDAGFRALMKHLQMTPAPDASGAPLVTHLPGRTGWELRLVVQGGLRILKRIRQVDGDVFRQRPKLGRADWLRLIGWKALNYP
jgi:phytoene/squalene synthetase